MTRSWLQWMVLRIHSILHFAYNVNLCEHSVRFLWELCWQQVTWPFSVNLRLTTFTPHFTMPNLEATASESAGVGLF